MQTVGVRKFRDRLGFYLRAAQSGETIMITKWGRPVARLVPVAPPERAGLDLQERMAQLAADGVIIWNGGPFKLPDPVATNRTPTLLSDLVVADRG